MANYRYLSGEAGGVFYIGSAALAGLIGGNKWPRHELPQLAFDPARRYNVGSFTKNPSAVGFSVMQSELVLAVMATGLTVGT